MDVTQELHWQNAVKAAVDKWGKVDILVNNAGTTYRNKPTLEVTSDEFDKVFNVNVKSIYLSVQAVIPIMKKQGHGGSIINISSIGSMRPRPGLVWYNSSKGAVTNVSGQKRLSTSRIKLMIRTGNKRPGRWVRTRSNTGQLSGTAAFRHRSVWELRRRCRHTGE